MSDPLTAAELQLELADVELVRRIRFFEKTGSTSRWAAAHVAEAGADGAHGTLAVADHQSAGHGRYGRAWLAPPGRALLFTLILDEAQAFASDAHGAVRLTAAAALSVRAALEACGAQDAALKFPNDVLLGGRKAAGILVERMAAARGVALLCGIGVNVNQRADELPPEAEAASLVTAGLPEQPRAQVLRSILQDLGTRMTQTPRSLFAAYARHCTTLGRVVRVTLPDGPITGTARAVTEEGALLIEPGDAPPVAVYSGEIIHLRSA